MEIIKKFFDCIAKFNLRKLKDAFPSIADKIDVRLTPPDDDAYFTNLLKVI
jgi:hypothetical protein